MSESALAQSIIPKAGVCAVLFSMIAEVIQLFLKWLVIYLSLCARLPASQQSECLRASFVNRGCLEALRILIRMASS